jgi:hypothetical protein
MPPINISNTFFDFRISNGIIEYNSLFPTNFSFPALELKSTEHAIRNAFNHGAGVASALVIQFTCAEILVA